MSTLSLEQLRDQIDAIDLTIIANLNARAALAILAGKAKNAVAARAYAPERERQILERLTQHNQGPLSNEAVLVIYKEIISSCLSLESPLHVSFLGPEATFTHEATKRHFGLSARLIPVRSIAEVFTDVERGRCTYGVVPIENSTEGIVNHTLDAFMSSDLLICAEVLLSVSHHLMSQTGNLDGVTKVYSHPQVLAQCRHWLRLNMPSVPLVDVASSARAAQLVREDATAAALASDVAATMYDLKIITSHLEDVQGNLTRFLVIGTDRAAPTQNDRTSIMFALRDEPGILFSALRPFAERHINMSRIESRPSRRRAWDYLFFIDLEGHGDQEHIAQAITDLQSACAFMKVLGSYPRGTLRP